MSYCLRVFGYTMSKHSKAERTVARLLWDGNDLITVYTDGTMHRFVGAYFTSHKTVYPKDSAVVVEDITVTMESPQAAVRVSKNR